MTETATPQKGAGMAIAALILGIVAVVTALIPVIGFFLIWVPAILALIFGIIGALGSRPKRGIALAGAILAVVSVIVAIATFAAGAAATKSAIDAAVDTAAGAVATSDAGTEATSGDSTVVYEVTGDGVPSTISYSTYDNGSFGSSTATDATLPWSTTQTISNAGGVFDLNSLTVTAMGSAETTTLSCKITVNGEVVAEQTSTGAYAMVICTDVQ